MYESLIDHFGVVSGKRAEKDLEADLPTATSSTNNFTDIEQKNVTPHKEWKPTVREWMVMLTMATSSLIVALDATILVPVLPTLAIDLHGTSVEAFWTGTSYLLSHAVLQPFIAALSDIFGRQQLLLPSLLFFTIGSIVCAVAHNFTDLLAGRVVQGVGGAGIITLSQIIFADLVPLRQRPKFFILVLLAWAVGSVLGPLIGGLFVEKATWRWCFYINLPICGIALPMAFIFVRLRGPLANLSLGAKIGHVGWVGNLSFITGLTLFLIGITWGGIQYEWDSSATLISIIFGAIIIIATVVWEVKFSVNPFLKRSLIRQPSAVASYIAAMFQGLALYIALYYLAFYFSTAKLKSPIQSGLSLFPATVLLLPGSSIVSVLITRTGQYRWAVWIGWAVATLGCGLFIMCDDKTTTAVWATALCIFGLGMGMVLSSINFSIQAVVDPEDAGTAAGTYAFVRSLGMAIGVAIGGSVFQNLMKMRLIELNILDATELAENAETFVEKLKHLEATAPDTPETIALMSGYVHGFRGIWQVMCAVCGIGLLVSLAIKHANMDKILDSRHVLEK